MTIANIGNTKTPTILEQARAEVQKEQSEKAKRLMVAKLREIAAATAVLKGLEAQLADLEQQANDGTI